MTPRSLFILILRVLGIFSTLSLWTSVPQLITTAIYFFRTDIGSGLLMIVVALISVAICLWISYTLIFKAEILVTKYGLDKGFTEEVFQLNISIPSVLRISIIIVGAWLLINELPELFSRVYNIIAADTMAYNPNGKINWSPVVLPLAKIVIGLLIVGERNRILTFLISQPIKETEEQL